MGAKLLSSLGATYYYEGGVGSCSSLYYRGQPVHKGTGNVLVGVVLFKGVSDQGYSTKGSQALG